MNQRVITDWVIGGSIPITSIKNNKKNINIFENKYFYLEWNNYNDYSISWENKKPLNFNVEKQINIKGYPNPVIFIGNIKYNMETISLIDQGKNYYCTNKSFLKSHLQKCVRQGHVQKALVTSFSMIENDISDFLRRLPIIILEDTHMIYEIDIIVWFMVMCQSITVPESFKKWLLYIVKFITKFPYKDEYDKTHESIDIEHIQKLTGKSKSTILSLIIRKSYGGMTGDILMINYLVNKWILKMIKYESLPTIIPKQVIIKRTLEPDQYELSAVDFHCWPDILTTIHEKYPSFCIDIIKKTIWTKSSKINFREKNTYTDPDIDICWDIIKYYLYKIQRKYIIKSIHVV